MRDVFRKDEMSTVRVVVDTERSIYASGEVDDALYLVESGQVKLFMSSAGGRDCVIAIYAEGDIFGDNCLSTSKRIETATAMRPSVVRRMARRDFMATVQRLAASEKLIQFLAIRVAERQTAMFDLVTMDSARRLVKALLGLAEKIGATDGGFLQIEPRMSQEELAQIVGTTRPRVTAFMQHFRRLGIIDTPGPRSIRIHEQKARAYLESV
jgi:CRP-like cAMP-binding protein